jgi:hypothetical protein
MRTFSDEQTSQHFSRKPIDVDYADFDDDNEDWRTVQEVVKFEHDFDDL